MMSTMIKAGKHYICVSEISHIQYIEGRLDNMPYKMLSVYEFSMKNGQFLKISEEEFKEFSAYLSYIGKEA